MHRELFHDQQVCLLTTMLTSFHEPTQPYPTVLSPFPTIPVKQEGFSQKEMLVIKGQRQEHRNVSLQWDYSFSLTLVLFVVGKMTL